MKMSCRKLILAIVSWLIIHRCDAGQFCASCSGIADPDNCQHHIRCDNDEKCYSHQYTNDSGSAFYDLGCISSQACFHSREVVVGKRAAGHHFNCLSCCNETSLCNQNFVCGGMSKADAGLFCAFCSGVTSPDKCQHQNKCEHDEECYIHKYTTESGPAFYDLGCIKPQACPSSHESIFGKRAEGHHFKCMSCCNDANLCNQNVTCGGITNTGTIPVPSVSTSTNGVPPTLVSKTTTETSIPSTPTTTTTPTTTSTVFARACSDLVGSYRRNGTYNIYPYGAQNISVSVYCLFDSKGTWTVIQRRFNGSVDFYRGWDDYKRGFGTTNGEYWLGNDVIHEMTSHSPYELKVVLTDFQNETRVAEYSLFRIDDEAHAYKLTIGGYSGNAGDSLKHHDGQMFSTFDHDNDLAFGSCAVVNHGAWWYSACYTSNLNGRYFDDGHSPTGDGIAWEGMDDDTHSLKSTTMMIKKK